MLPVLVPKGVGGTCGHVAGLLYQLASYMMAKLRAVQEDVAKTSQPQTWHKPRGKHIAGTEVQNLQVVGYAKNTTSRCKTDRNTMSTLYNPIRGELPSLTNLRDGLQDASPNALVIPMLITSTNIIQTKYGVAPVGSALAIQQKLHSHYILNIYDGLTFPSLPMSNKMINNNCTVLSQKQQVELDGLILSNDEIQHFEECTRLQSDSKLWHKLREFRITASKMHSVYVRRKNQESLAARLKSTRRVQKHNLCWLVY